MAANREIRAENCGNGRVRLAALALAGERAGCRHRRERRHRQVRGRLRARCSSRQMGALGLKQSVMTMRFVPSDPTTIQDGDALDRAIPVARARRPPRRARRLSLSAARDRGRHGDAGRRSRPGSTLVAQRYPTVQQYVVMNEPNQPAFLRPQFGPTGKNVSAARAGAFLAAGYDALKAVDPTIQVIGLGLSPRGNDQPDRDEQRLDLAGAVPRCARRAGTARAAGRCR